MYEGMMHGGWMWLGTILSSLFGLVLLALFVLAAVWLYQQVTGPGAGGSGTGGDDALEILRSRYAKGEISEEEFRRMKRELGGG